MSKTSKVDFSYETAPLVGGAGATETLLFDEAT